MKWIWLLILLLVAPCSGAKLDLYDKPTSLKTPDDALVYWFPIIDRLRILTFRDYALKLDYQAVKIKKREHIPGHNGLIQCFVQLQQNGGMQTFAETQVGYINQIDPNRWVWFLPTGYAVGVKPLAIGQTDVDNDNRVLFLFRTHILDYWGE